MKKYINFILIILPLLALTNCANEKQNKPEEPQKEDNYEIIENLAKRMPAEFEPSSMIKMVYPNNMPLSVYKEISENNKILLLVNKTHSNKSRIQEAKNAFSEASINLDNITFIDADLDEDYSCWIRDCSPFYVFNDLDLSIVDFTYNRPDRKEQNKLPIFLSDYFKMPYSKMGITHTGGNLMQNGRGTAFSDDLVVSENNNNKSKVINAMKEYTGTDNYVITIDPQGDYIAHIDCWAKIVAPDKIIVAKLPEKDKRYSYYEEVANILANTKCSYGYNYRIYRIDEPGGEVVAPYTNSLIANNYIYMPLGENEEYNNAALEVYKQALPNYTVVGLEGFESGDDVFLNTDALHCRTHEVPDSNMVFIDSRDVYHGEVELIDEYCIKANIIAYSGEELNSEMTKIYYSINDGEYVEAKLERYLETSNYTYTFKNLKNGDDVKYYLEASDNNNNKMTDPTCGKKDPHHFIIK